MRDASTALSLKWQKNKRNYDLPSLFFQIAPSESVPGERTKENICKVCRQARGGSVGMFRYTCQGLFAQSIRDVLQLSSTAFILSPVPTLPTVGVSQESLSEPLLLSRLISICSEGRLSSRLFFILLDCCSFCLIIAPHTFCSWVSSSSLPSSPSDSLSSRRLIPLEEVAREEALSSSPLSLWDGPRRLHKPPENTNTISKNHKRMFREPEELHVYLFSCLWRTLSRGYGSRV